ncbi:MAG TPA: hypothetical protein PLJ38_06475, partial [bacterium]|nr:hypothetical protein [bacterium]
ESVVENIITVILRKYKIIKHYICAIYNDGDKLVITLNVETTLKKSDLLPLIFDTLKSNIKESIENTVCIAKPETIEIIVDKLKRLQK